MKLFKPFSHNFQCVLELRNGASRQVSTGLRPYFLIIYWQSRKKERVLQNIKENIKEDFFT